MNLAKKILLSGAGVALSTTAVVAPLIVLNQNSNSNKIEKNNAIDNSIGFNNTNLLKDGNIIENHLNAVNLKTIDNIINEKTSTNSINTLSMFSKKTITNKKSAKAINAEKLLKQKAILIAQKIMDKKMSMDDLFNFLNQKESTISKKFLNKLKNREIKNTQNAREILNKELKMHELFSNFLTINQSITQTISSIQNKLKWTAGEDTAASIAAAAIATAMWWIPFFGWADSAAATTAAVANGVVSGVTWANYYGINNDWTQAISDGTKVIGLGQTFIDWLNADAEINGVLEDALDNIKNIITAQLTDMVINTSTMWADPEVDVWYIPIIEGTNLFLDIFMVYFNNSI